MRKAAHRKREGSMAGRLSATRRDALRLAGASAVALAGVARTARAATGSLEQIRKRGYLLYGFNGERPYNYMAEDGTLVGSEIELARAVAKGIGIDEVQGVAMNFDSFIPAILAGRIDTCLPIFVKPARCERILFARPHLMEAQSAIVAAGNPKGIHGWDDLIGKDVKVGLVAGTTPAEIARTVGVPEDRITSFPDTTTLTAGMRSGRVDVVVEAGNTIRLVFADLGQAGFERVEGWRKPSGYKDPIQFYAAFPFAKDAADLRDAFDQQLAKLVADGTVAKIGAAYGFGPADRPGPDAPTLEQICKG
jgi:polar amino acid transport system substrate-binding protein